MWPDLELIGLYPLRFSGLYFTGKGVFPFSIKQEGNGPLDSQILDNADSIIFDSKYGLIIEISSFNYLDTHVHLVLDRQPLRPWGPPNSLSGLGCQF